MKLHWVNVDGYFYDVSCLVNLNSVSFLIPLPPLSSLVLHIILALVLIEDLRLPFTSGQEGFLITTFRKFVSCVSVMKILVISLLFLRFKGQNILRSPWTFPSSSFIYKCQKFVVRYSSIRCSYYCKNLVVKE